MSCYVVILNNASSSIASEDIWGLRNAKRLAAKWKAERGGEIRIHRIHGYVTTKRREQRGQFRAHGLDTCGCIEECPIHGALPADAVVIHGRAPGADMIADRLERRRGPRPAPLGYVTTK